MLHHRSPRPYQSTWSQYDRVPHFEEIIISDANLEVGWASWFVGGIAQPKRHDNLWVSRLERKAHHPSCGTMHDMSGILSPIALHFWRMQFYQRSRATYAITPDDGRGEWNSDEAAKARLRHNGEHFTRHEKDWLTRST